MIKVLPTTILRLLSIALLSLFTCSHSHASNKDTASSTDDGKVRIKENIIVLKSKGESSREVTINLPQVSGLKDDKALDKLKDLLSLKNIFGVSLEEIREEVSEGDLGTQGVGFEVNYNQHNLLDINFWMEGMGAYPSTTNVHRTINLKTGEVLTATEVFNKTQLDKLVEKVKGLKKSAERESLEDPHYSKDEREMILNGIKSAETYDLKNLDNFSISDKGITFLYNYDTFPHAIQALEPSGWYFINYQDLKPFINPKGPLGVFVNKT